MRQPTWTDAELIDHDFDLLGRPDVDPGLSPARPPPDTPLVFLQSYNITPPADAENRQQLQPYVWCALCQEPTHWIGWVAEAIEQAGRRRILVGQHCAKRKGGAAVRVATNDFTARQDRAGALRSRRSVLAVADQVRSALERWWTSPGVAAVDTWRNALGTLAPDYSYELMMAAEVSPPVLLESVEVRDLAAEALRDQRTRGRSKDFPIYRTEYRPIANLQCRAVYWGESAHKRIVRIALAFEAAVAALQAPSDELHTRDLKEILRQVREVANDARGVARAFAKSPEAMSLQAVDGLMRWLNKQPKTWPHLDVRYVRQGRHMIRAEPGAKHVVVSIPEAPPILCPPEMDLLEEALLGRAA